MDTTRPDLQWYTDISTSRNLSPRCPFASVHRCPRYYESIGVLADAGITTPMEPAEDGKLLEKWKHSDLWPATKEQASQIMGPEGKPSHFFNFCPEISFDRFRWFASDLSRHADEIDADVRQQNLLKEGAASQDWRWNWSLVIPRHYADCPLYSPLLLGVNDIKTPGQIGFSV